MVISVWEADFGLIYQIIAIFILIFYFWGLFLVIHLNYVEYVVYIEINLSFVTTFEKLKKEK